MSAGVGKSATAGDDMAAALARAESAEKSGDLAAAKAAYVAALRELPDHALIKRRLAQIEQRCGDHDAAARLNRQADETEIAQRLAVAQSLIGTPLETKALAMAAQAARDFPRAAAAHCGHAQFLRRSGRLPEAIASLQAGLAAEPDHEPSRLLLATLQQKTRIDAGVRPTPLRLLPNFLSSRDHDRLLSYALANESIMQPSTVQSDSGKPDWRRSRVVQGDRQIEQWFVPLIAARAAGILADFGYGDLAIESIGFDWVASNDGDFYKHHVDTGPGHYARRTVSFVYYFNRQPKGFSGGELALYDTDLATGEFSMAHCTLLEPLDNRLVLFPSTARHEIRPVRCPSRDFADSRFTLNGWIRRAA